MAYIFLVVLFAAAVSAAPTLQDIDSPFPREVNIIKADPTDYRLPASVKPLKYNIKLIPFLVEGNFTFDGSVLISVQALEAVTNITLHAKRLTIDSSQIVVKELLFNEDVPVTGVEIDDVQDFYTILLGETLRAGTQYTISIPQFTGILDNDMAGFYRSSYVENGVRRWLGITQFEATDARRAFPCFDEPALKAQVTLSISRPENLRAVANMPQDGVPQLDTEHTDEVRYWDNFQESPPMSTYLVAFLVSDFVFLENAAENLRIYAQPQMISQARYSLSVSPGLLNAMADFTGIGFQLPKMDEAAIPDFDAGAMENWGLVTYRERLILFEEGVSTSSSRQSIATVIAHEYAHQWFGDLVSPLWWKYLWLNEGFATYFEFFDTAKVETTWRLEEQFVVSEVHGAMSSDASQNSHPMTNDVTSPGSISNIFDGISYSKSGVVIRMMEHIVSSPIFQRGLRRYLIARSYDAASADDLFNNMNDQLHEDNPDVADLDLKAVMDSWSLQMGYPVVNVTRDYAANSAVLTQERFLLSVIPDHPDDHVYKWYIPLTYTTEASPDFSSTSPQDWFNVDDDTKTIENLAASTQWVLFNIKENGYYRVNYDPTNWELLTSYLNSPQYEVIDVLNRAQLIDDSFNLARAKINPYAIALSLSQYLTRESDYIAWRAAFSAFSFIDRKLSNSLDYTVFQTFLLGLIDTLYTSVGFDEGPEDGHILKLNRAQAVKWACDLRDQDCIDHSSISLAEWIATPDTNPIKPDLKSVIYCTALRAGGSTEWDFIYQQYLDNNVATESTLFISALGCSTDEATLRAYMDLAIAEDSVIRRQDTSSVFSSVYSQPTGVNVALDYVIEEFDRIAQYYGSVQSVANLLFNIANRCNTQQQADKLSTFLAENETALGSSAGTITRAIEVIGENILWQTTQGQEIIDWINANPATNYLSK